ncbi:MAG: T9SS type A sorting domain-containing protein, partial [Bacteroidota bacterium]|nr:T9SS type A sorting domain-containing protein [Bacteroidota bacterium]
YDGTAWSNYTVIESSLGSFCYDVTNASNDVFLLWKNSSINCLQMKQYDAIPFKVQHPQVGNNPGNNYIRLIWDKNNEPDITNYEVSRKVNETGSIWQVLGTTSNNYYIDNEYLYTNPYGDFHLTYRIRAKDLNNQYSTYSDEATSRAEGNGLFKKATLKLSTESTLNQNFPNPFNPSTEIEFTIRKASQVKLTVYDVLGNEVAVLVNGMKNPGNYRAQFDGNKLASGIYIYKLVTSEQQIVRKMLLAK